MRTTLNRITSFVHTNLTEDVQTWVLESLYDYGSETEFEGYIYKYAGKNNTNTDTNPALADKWVKIRPSNLVAMLDEKSSTVSTGADEIVIKFISKGFDKLALFNLIAKKVIVTVTSLFDAEVTKTIEKPLLNTALITTFRDFCTAQLEQKQILYMDLPILYNCEVTVTIENIGAIAQCGNIISGKSFYIGDTNWDIGLGATSYSKKDINSLGEIDFIKRGITDTDDFVVTVDTKRAFLIKQKLKEYDAELLLFTILEGSNYLDPIMNFGYWEDFNILLSGPIKSEANMTIQGVI